MDLAEWLLKNGAQISVAGLLGFALVAAALALHRRWVVLGWVHADVAEERDRLRVEAEAAVEATKARLAELERAREAERARRT